MFEMSVWSNWRYRAARLKKIDKLLHGLIAVATSVYRSFFWRPLLPDANDDLVLEAALSGHADLLVTADSC